MIRRIYKIRRYDDVTFFGPIAIVLGVAIFHVYAGALLAALIIVSGTVYTIINA